MINTLVRLLAARQNEKVPKVFGGGVPTVFGQTRDPKIAEQLQAYHHFTFAAIRTRATRVAELDFELFRVSKSNGDRNVSERAWHERARKRRRLETRHCGISQRSLNRFERAEIDIEEVHAHPFLVLMEQPNTQHEKTGFILKERTEIHLALTGNAYWLIIKDGMNIPREIWILRPDRMAGVVNRDGYLTGWAFMRDDGSHIELATDEVVHFKLAAPVEDIFGWSLVKAGAFAHDTQTFMNVYHRNFFKNSARPDYVLTTDQPIGEDQAKMILSNWKAEFGGVDRAHMPAVLGSGLTPKALQLTNTDIQFLGIADWNLDQLIAIYGVPKAKLGLVADANRSNAEAADVTFNRETIRPEMLRITEEIEHALLSLYPQSEGSHLDLGFPDPVPEDRQFELEKRLEEFRGGIRTLNESRVAADLEPFSEEFGDRIKIQMQDILVPVDASTDVLESVMGVPMPGATGQDIPIEGLEDGQGDIEPPRQLAGAREFPAWSTDTRRELWWWRWLVRQSREEDLVSEFMESEFRRQQKDVLDAIRTIIVDDTAPGRQIDPTIEEILRTALGPEVDEAMLERLSAVLVRISTQEGNYLLEQLGINATIPPGHPELINFLDTKPLRVQGINNVTREAVRAELKEALAIGESLNKIENRILSVFETTPERARLIARTETIGAMNAGSQAAMVDAEVPYKMWLSAQDGRVRETHAAASGQIVKVNEAFRVGAALLEFPGDPRCGDPGEVCNCRCTHVPKMSR